MADIKIDNCYENKVYFSRKYLHNIMKNNRNRNNNNFTTSFHRNSHSSSVQTSPGKQKLVDDSKQLTSKR